MMSRLCSVVLLTLVASCSNDTVQKDQDLTASDKIATDTTDDSSQNDTLTDSLADARLDTTPDGSESDADATTNADSDAAEEVIVWSEERTKTVDDIRFLSVDGRRFFAIGFHTGDGLVWDGVAGPGECDKDTQKGYLDINIEKTHKAAEAGANMVYLWSYKERTKELIDVTPRFKGRFHSQYGTAMPVEDDVVPVFYNAFGESDLDGFDQAEVDKMAADFADFSARAGKYSLENMPNLPPVDKVGHFAWHPTFRMIGTGDGKSEMLTPEQATALAQTTNMMIGDNYTYVENRFDLSIPGEAIMAAATGQKGNKGEGYDYWLSIDDPEHRSYFSGGWDLAHSLVTKGKPDSVVWMWLQGYSFGDSIAAGACEDDGPNDSWAAGGFPTKAYLIKEITSVVAAGATGIVYFGFNNTRWPEADIMISTFKVLASQDVYEPALLSPTLDLGIDTRFLGEAGYNGMGRCHALVKWHAASRTAYVIAANPGARATTLELPFPWSIAKVDLMNWDTAEFEPVQDIEAPGTVLKYTMPLDSGVILKVTPVFE